MTFFEDGGMGEMKIVNLRVCIKLEEIYTPYLSSLTYSITVIRN